MAGSAEAAAPEIPAWSFATIARSLNEAGEGGGGDDGEGRGSGGGEGDGGESSDDGLAGELPRSVLARVWKRERVEVERKEEERRAV